jgi:hypothetical protein
VDCEQVGGLVIAGIGAAAFVRASWSRRVDEHRQQESRRLAESVERQRRERAAIEAVEAQARADRERDRDASRPADDVLTDAMRRGGRR